MSGIFRFNSNNASPNRRSSIIPYCTSAGQSHDVTADHSNTTIFGYRSPTLFGVSASGSPSGGTTSPGNRASLRDYDEKLQTLVKDNFNLKLRIYFMENTTNKMQNEGKEALCKQIVDLKVETEALRAELKDKQTLICEAATALELMDQTQKALKEENEAALEEMHQRNNFLKLEIKALESGSPGMELSEVLARSTMNIAAQEHIAELERELAASKEEQGALAKRLEEAENRAAVEEEQRLKQEHSCAEKSVAYEKGRKVIRTLLEKQNTLENELKSLKEQKSYRSNGSDGLDSHDLSHLQDELAAAQRDAADAHKWRNDCVDVCGALTVRLKELAEFLDSLLSNKELLNVIAQDRRKMMRRCVDKTLDISKSVRRMSLSMTSTGFTLNDSTLLTQLTSLTDVLHNSMAVMDTSFNDKENRPSNYFDRRSFKLDAPDVSDVISRAASRKDQSESEDWSEPDRQVSHERIGLDGNSILRNSYRVSPNKNNTLDVSNTSTASNSEPGSDKARRNAVVRLQSRIADLERQIIERDELQLVQNEELLEKRETVQVLEKRIALLEHNDEDFIRLQNERDSLGVDLRVSTMKLESLQEELNEMKKRHNGDIDQIMLEQRTLIENVKRNSNDRHQADVTLNYVPKSDHHFLSHQFQEQEKKVADMERLVQDLRESETEWKAEILEKEQNLRAMKKSLDEAMLFTSKAHLEHIELLSEKKNIERARDALIAERDALIVKLRENNVSMSKLEIDNAKLNNFIVSEKRPELCRIASSGNVSADEKLMRMQNFSPDLGIESDAGRTSGSDREQQNRSAPAQMLTADGGSSAEVDQNFRFDSDAQPSAASHNCAEVDRLVVELRRDNQRKTENSIKILEMLRISNGKKEQTERDIRRELLKTEAVLKIARVNFKKEE